MAGPDGIAGNPRPAQNKRLIGKLAVADLAPELMDFYNETVEVNKTAIVQGDIPLQITDFRFRLTDGIEAWYVGGNPSSMLGTLSSKSFQGNTLIAIPFVSPIAGHLDKLGFHVNGGQATGDAAKCAIYDSVSQINPYPNKLLAAGAEQDCSTTGPMKTDIDLDIETGKLYWLVFFSNNSSMEIAYIPDGYLGGLSALGSDLQSVSTHIESILTYGDFPAIFPAGTSLSSQSMPLIAVRYSS